jgi:Ca2+-binding RTX toxin-like protein
VGEVQDYYLTVSQVIQNGDDIQIGGSNTVSDRIIISMGNGGVLNVKINGITYNAFDDINEFTTITVRPGGGDDNITTVKLVIPITVFGGPGNDYIAGTSFNDTLFGEAGNDRILGALGDDFIDGGDGNDSLDAGQGNDTMYGGAGNDKMWGQAGDDVMYGDLSPDDLSEQSPGNDTMDGGLGNDLMHGGDGNDSMTGNAGNDVVVGEAGNDRVLGAAGRDILIGGDGADSLDGGADDDILIGSATVNDSDDSILLAALDEWANSGDSYEDRVASLSGGDFSPDGNVLQDDGAKDLLTGQGGRDWYMGSLTDNDQIRGRVATGPDAEQFDT